MTRLQRLAAVQERQVLIERHQRLTGVFVIVLGLFIVGTVTITSAQLDRIEKRLDALEDTGCP